MAAPSKKRSPRRSARKAVVDTTAESGSGTDGASKPERKKRRPYRRGQILDTAIQLFYEHGYHATGIQDIGAAAGLTGPAIYRHFKNKEEILETAVREYSELALQIVKDIAESSGPPEQVLDQMADSLVHMLLDNIAAAAVYATERRNLSEPARRHGDRAARLFLEEWAHVITRVRPDLSDGEARLMANAVIQLARSLTVYKSGVARERVAKLMKEMILGAVSTD